MLADLIVMNSHRTGVLVGAKADVWGRKPFFLIALAVLTVRGCLYPLSENPYWLVGVQLLDGALALYLFVMPETQARESAKGEGGRTRAVLAAE
jgi:MFS family permease